MNLYELAKETKELKEDVKREKRNFKAKIKTKVKEYKAKEETIKNYLKEALKEYEYRNVEVKPISIRRDDWHSNGKATIYYPYIKFKDIYVMEYENFEIKKVNDLEMIYHSYALRDKENGKLIEVEESAVLNIIIRDIIFEIKVEGIEFDIVKNFDI